MATENNENKNNNGAEPQVEEPNNKKMSTGKKILIGVLAVAGLTGIVLGTVKVVKNRRAKKMQ